MVLYFYLQLPQVGTSRIRKQLLPISGGHILLSLGCFEQTRLSLDMPESCASS